MPLCQHTLVALHSIAVHLSPHRQLWATAKAHCSVELWPTKDKAAQVWLPLLTNNHRHSSILLHLPLLVDNHKVLHLPARSLATSRVHRA